MARVVVSVGEMRLHGHFIVLVFVHTNVARRQVGQGHKHTEPAKTTPEAHGQVTVII